MNFHDIKFFLDTPVCVCMYIYIYIYTYTHTHTHTILWGYIHRLYNISVIYGPGPQNQS